MKNKLFKIVSTVGVLALVIFFVLVACSGDKKHFKMATGPHATMYNVVGGQIARHWAYELKLKIEEDSSYGTGPIASCSKLANREVDFALIQDDAPLDSCIDKKHPKDETALRTICPLYPEILFVVHQPEIKANSLAELIKGKKVGLGPKNCAGARFVLKLFEESGISKEEFTPVYTDYKESVISDSLPIVCALTAFNDPRINKMLNQLGGKLFSLDDPQLVQKGSSVDGFCMKYQHAHPFVIPKNTYGRWPETPILTLAIDVLLVTHKDVDDVLVYKLTHALIDEEQILANQNVLFHFMEENFDRRSLDFPLHEGALHYFERERPSFFEEHAEVLGLGITIGGLIFAFLGGLRQWYIQKRRDKIDEYYQKALIIEKNTHSCKTSEDYINAIHELDILQEEAVQKLMSGKLNSDSHFTIFMSLVNNERQALVHKLQVLKEKV